jgi:membrane protein DedA with SNARE-associated domain
MSGFIIHSIDAWGHWAYVFLFLGLLFEGETFLFAAFFLARQGHLSLGGVFIVAFFGVLAGDWMWYWVGHHLERFTWLASKMGAVAGPIDRQLLKRPLHTLFLSKFIYGIHRITQIRSGAIRIEARTFWQADMSATFFWVGSIALLGYASAVSIRYLSHIFKYTEVAFLFALIVFFLLAHGVSWYNKRHLEEDMKTENPQ